jgi:hypothetical protein
LWPLAVFLAVLFPAIIIYFLFWPRIDVLTIREFETDGLRRCAEIKPGEAFIISYIHSVNKRPVHDTLTAQNHQLVIVKSRFDAFGAGMPEATTEQGTLAIAPDGWMEWTVNRVVPEIVVRVGRVAEHTLSLKGRRFRLTDLAEPGLALSFRIQRTSLFDVIKGRCIRD